MKTINGATGSKSNLLRALAIPFLFLVAIFGIIIGGNSTPKTSGVEPSTDIHGQQVPKPSSPFVAEIGGQSQQVPKDNNPLGIGGGQSAPRSMAVSEPIGGQNNQNKPQVPDPLGNDIGGQRVSGSTIPLAVEIGGNGNLGIPQMPNPPGEIGGQRVPGRPYPAVNEIGGNGNSIPQIPNPLGEIGANGDQGVPQMPNPPGEIGGQSSPCNGGYISSFLTDCTVDIGGNQGNPKPPLPFSLPFGNSGI